ncbi:uncharacterized protein METZ01_LOCUS112194 [marine metagenome]|jgi:hypothetical protein|uniref:Uncharacterized protein n=1 Tax=marine metagenome TaxID=408172 RepID=A0A381X3Y8_9ZZZZ
MRRQINERSPGVSTPLPVMRMSIHHHIASAVTQSIMDNHLKHIELLNTPMKIPGISGDLA